MQFSRRFHEVCTLIACVLLLLAVRGPSALAADDKPSISYILRGSNVPGGLCVQIGAGDVTDAISLAWTGQFLVHVLDADAATVAEARKLINARGSYGLISVEQSGGDKLPYTENLVNVLIVNVAVSVERMREISRVLCPNGVMLALGDNVTADEMKNIGLTDIRDVTLGDRAWRLGRKPWPVEMDEWSHPSHAADGNTVSRDTVVGPPRRVRWVTGPWVEVSNMVSANGRNYYGGILTRDGFNGLRLWETRLTPSPAKGSFSAAQPAGTAPPVAGNGWLFVHTDGKLRAFDGASGKVARDYDEGGKPNTILYDQGVLIAIDATSVRALDAVSGRLLWKHDASDPRAAIVADGIVAFVSGNAKRGEKVELIVLDQSTGKVRWRRDNAPWAPNVTRTVYHGGVLSYETSTINDNGPGNGIHLVSAADGKPRWDKPFMPAQSHMRQARAMFVGDRMWILAGGRNEEKKYEQPKLLSLNVATGQVEVSLGAGLAHCFPPIATPNYVFSGELDLTDLTSGQVDANRITKGACGRDAGWIPANGLVYMTPKHCVCWPMLRGYVALAAARPGGDIGDKKLEELDLPIESISQAPAPSDANAIDEARDWPIYRHDSWRSGSTPGSGPTKLDVLWSTNFGSGRGDVRGPILQDWDENPFVKGPISAPVIAGGKVFIARPDAHEVVAMNATSGKTQWRFVATSRVDTPPTIHRGMCLFGCKSGWVYCLNATDGSLIWRRRAAPLDERIVAFGGVESPWPVPGSVLVFDDVAYFAAGRQSLADGGILVFAVDPATGKEKWIQRLDTVPQKGFYQSSGIEFDNFDLLHREGDSIGLSRWVFNCKDGAMSIDPWKAFAQIDTGHGSVMAPQGCWSYAPRHQQRTKLHEQRRPLVVFRDKVLFGCSQTRQGIYRRDFDLENGEKFETKWITGWAASGNSSKGTEAYRSDRLSAKATWKAPVYEDKPTAPRIDAMTLAGDRLYLVGSDGKLRVVGTKDGSTVTTIEVPAPLWDGMAIAQQRLFLATADGRLLCLGDSTSPSTK